MGRAPCCEKVGLKRGRWTAEEDDILTKYIQANGEGSWRSLPKNAGLLRFGKSCRLRWVNYLKSDLKRGKFSSAEDDVIIRLLASLGNRWSIIAGSLQCRTDNEIKNYWNSHLRRQIHTFRRPISNPIQRPPPPVMDLPKPVSVGNNIDIVPKRRGGRTSRSAMKNNKFYYFPTKKHYNHPPTPKLLETTSGGHEFENGKILLVPQPQTPTLKEETNYIVVKSNMHLDPHEDEEITLEAFSWTHVLMIL